jgi:hypothetical protein
MYSASPGGGNRRRSLGFSSKRGWAEAPGGEAGRGEGKGWTSHMQGARGSRQPGAEREGGEGKKDDDFEGDSSVCVSSQYLTGPAAGQGLLPSPNGKTAEARSRRRGNSQYDTVRLISNKSWMSFFGAIAILGF